MDTVLNKAIRKVLVGANLDKWIAIDSLEFTTTYSSMVPNGVKTSKKIDLCHDCLEQSTFPLSLVEGHIGRFPRFVISKTRHVFIFSHFLTVWKCGGRKEHASLSLSLVRSIHSR